MSASFTRLAFALTFFALVFAPVPALAQLQVEVRPAIMTQARQIGLCLFAYATDNNGAYPTGKSSTEIFQKLIDGGYASDPALFYVKMAGKVAPTSNKLKPENVCFDVTVPVDGNSSDLVPLVYITGFKIDYKPGSSAQPVTDAAKTLEGITIFYKGNNVILLKKAVDGSIPNAVSPNFNDANAPHYQQMTPNGPLQTALTQR